ncbi:MAG: protease modulator HflC [Geminicoccaceae bacterium]
MNRNILIGVGACVAVLLLLGMSALFTVHQTQQALVLQFGDPKRVIKEAGLHFKLPFVQNAVYIDRRVLDFDAAPQELILGDQKRLVVDSFARYRIVDPLLFYQAVGTEEVLRARIGPILESALRKVLGEVPLFTVLSADRVQLMNRIRDLTNTGLKQFGIEVVDVRIKRADLPAENSQAIYRRMQTERGREAKELRAQGAELAQRIRARADRERRVIIAEAKKEGQIIRGQGDAKAIGIFADAFGRDVPFFTFYRSMQAYRDALGDDNTSFVLSPQSEFFKYFDRSELPPVQSAKGAGEPNMTGNPESQETPPGGRKAAAAEVAPVDQADGHMRAPPAAARIE